MDVVIKLPYPPSLNTLYKWSPKGIYMSTEGKRYKNYVGLYVRSLNITPFDKDDDISMTILAYPKDNRVRDISNIEKLVGDSLKTILFPDDRQIKILHMEMREKRTDSHIEVTVSKIDMFT